jgi:hypothetical protein
VEKTDQKEGGNKRGQKEWHKRDKKEGGYKETRKKGEEKRD